MGTLLAERYTDEAFFKRERRLFEKYPLLAGHSSQFKKAGDYTTQKIFEREALLLHNGSETNAFYNYCAHRGMRLLEGSGRSRQLQCSYHGWCYDFNGQRISDQGRQRLEPLGLQRWQGLLFVNQSKVDNSYFAGLSEILKPYRLDTLELAQHRKVAVNCNWKALVDNVIEDYHVSTVHKSSLARFFELSEVNYRKLDNHVVINARLEQRIAQGLLQNLSKPPYLQLEPHHWNVYQKILVFPNTVINVSPYFMTSYTAWPVAVNRCLLEFRFYRRAGLGLLKGTVLGLRNLLTLFFSKKILKEDLSILETYQASLAARMIKRHALQPQEEGMALFHQQVDRALKQR